MLEEYKTLTLSNHNRRKQCIPVWTRETSLILSSLEAEPNWWHLQCLTKQTTVIWHVSKLIKTSFYFLTSNLIRCLIQPTLRLVWHAHMLNSPSLTDLIALSTPRGIFAQKYSKLRELFAFYTSRKFTLFTKQHYFTENRKEEKKDLIHRKSVLIKLHFNLTPRSLKRTFEQFSYLLPLKISNANVIK